MNRLTQADLETIKVTVDTEIKKEAVEALGDALEAIRNSYPEDIRLRLEQLNIKKYEETK